MKSIIYFCIAIVFALTSSLPVLAVDTFSCASVTEIPQVECEALIALYNITNGPGWKYTYNWLVTSTPSDWYGVAASGGHVSTLRLSDNQLNGSIPRELGNLPNLLELWLSGNQLSGSIPSELGSLNDLTILYLSNNQLSGSIPPELGSLANLQTLELGWNQLDGSIPPELGNLLGLQALALNSNQLSGSIPPTLGSLTNLIWLVLSQNQLSGNIPPELGNLINLTNIFLGNNQLSGSIPAVLGNLNNLTHLELGVNKLTGSISSSFGNMTNLVVLNLGQNQLIGSIPIDFGNLSNLLYLDIRNNQLSGSIPAQLGSLTNLQNLYLSGNQLSGGIPPELGNLTDLKTLWLQDNNLSGDIPFTFINLVNLYDPGGFYGNGLDLDFNMLNIPQWYPDPRVPLQVFLSQKDPDWQLFQGFTQMIDTGGGEFTSLDGRTNILIPAGALITDTTFTYIPQPAPQHESARLVFANNSFELSAEDSIGNPVTTFNLPLTITLTYTDTDVFGFTENTLGLYYWSDLTSTWADAVATCQSGAYTRNLEGNILALPLCHLTEFGLFGVPLYNFLPVVRR